MRCLALKIDARPPDAGTVTQLSFGEGQVLEEPFRLQNGRLSFEQIVEGGRMAFEGAAVVIAGLPLIEGTFAMEGDAAEGSHVSMRCPWNVTLSAGLSPLSPSIPGAPAALPTATLWQVPPDRPAPTAVEHGRGSVQRIGRYPLPDVAL